MPVPAIPPELVEAILRELPPSDAATIPALLACTLVSHSFYSIATQDSLWSPIARSCWTFGRLPTYARLSNEEDQREMKLAFPREKHSRTSVLERISARPTIKRIITRHLEALLAEPSNKIPHVLAIVELGETNAMPFLDELAFMEDDRLFPDDWLARRYWARQARGAISRRRAVAVWKRIGQGWDGNEAFYKGIFAFAAFRGTQDLDEVDKAVPFFGKCFNIAVDLMHGHELTSSTPEKRSVHHLGALLGIFVFRGAFKLFTAPGQRIRLDLDQLFPHDVLRRIVGLAKPKNAFDPQPSTHGQSDVLLNPLQLPGHESLIAIAWKPLVGSVSLEDWSYICFLTSTQMDHTMARSFFEQYRQAHPDDQPSQNLDAVIRHSARALVKFLPANMAQMLVARGVDECLNKDDDGTSLYAACLVNVLISIPANEQLTDAPVTFTDVEGSAAALVRTVDVRYPWDADLIGREVLQTCGLSFESQHLYLSSLDRVQSQDSHVHEIRKRSGLASSDSQPRFRVGDFVDFVNNQGAQDLCLVTGWQIFPVEASIHSDELDLGLGDLGGKVIFHLLDCEGADLAALDTANLQLRETLTEQQVERFSSRHDIGKYFKRVEWSGDRPRFVLGNDHAKLYPED